MPTITLELTIEQEERLKKKAARLGLDTAGYLRRLAEKSTEPRQRKRKAQTGAELAAALEALPGGYGDPNVDSATLARELRRQAETRSWIRD